MCRGFATAWQRHWQTYSRKWGTDCCENEWPWPLFRGSLTSYQPLRHICNWISPKQLEIDAWFQTKEPPIGNNLWGIEWSSDQWRHVTLKIKHVMLNTQYLENSWRYYLATIANLYTVCCEAVYGRLSYQQLSFLFVWVCNRPSTAQICHLMHKKYVFLRFFFIFWQKLAEKERRGQFHASWSLTLLFDLCWPRQALICMSWISNRRGHNSKHIQLKILILTQELIELLVFQVALQH